ncbi:MAG: hypothetical protein RJA36_1487 [Pseudomonadota bacterium]|jgi:hypothetical protein
MPPLVIRASSLSAYPDCSLRTAAHSQADLFAAKGVTLHPARTNVGALIGSGVHAGAELALKGRMNGERVPQSTCEDAAIGEFRARREKEAGAARLIVDETAGDANACERQVRRMVHRYRQDVVETARPLLVERRLEAEVIDGVILSGQGDLLHLDATATGDEQVVRDLKSTRRHMAQPMIHAPQLGGYSLLYRSRGWTPNRAQLDVLPRVRLEKPQPPVTTAPLAIAETEEIAHAVVHDFAGKLLAFREDGETSRFLVNPRSFLCSQKFCRLYGKEACPATRGLKL